MVLRPVRRVLDIQMSRTRVFHHSYCKDGVLASFPTINNGIQYSNAGRPVGFYRISTTKKNPKYRPNIDHTALYRPNIYKITHFATKVRMFIMAGPLYIYPISYHHSESFFWPACKCLIGYWFFSKEPIWSKVNPTVQLLERETVRSAVSAVFKSTLNPHPSFWEQVHIINGALWFELGQKSSDNSLVQLSPLLLRWSLLHPPPSPCGRGTACFCR